MSLRPSRRLRRRTPRPGGSGRLACPEQEAPGSDGGEAYFAMQKWVEARRAYLELLSAAHLLTVDAMRAKQSVDQSVIADLRRDLPLFGALLYIALAGGPEQSYQPAARLFAHIGEQSAERAGSMGIVYDCRERLPAVEDLHPAFDGC